MSSQDAKPTLSLGVIAKLKSKFGRKALLARLNARRDLVTSSVLYPWTLRIAVQPLGTEDGAGEERGAQGQLVLGVDVVQAFARTVASKLAIFSQTGPTSDPRIAVFTRSLKFVNFLFTAPGFDPGRLVEFKDLVLLVGDAVAKEVKGFVGENYPGGISDEVHDTLFLQVMDLFISSLREAIYSVDPSSQAVLHPDIRFYKSQVARFLRSTSAIQEEAETQQGSGVRLVDWCRVLFKTDVDVHNRETAEARKVATKKNLLLDVKSYLLKLEDPAQYLNVYEDEFSSPLAFQNWVKAERKYCTGLVNTLIVKFPELQSVLESSNTATPPPTQPSAFVPPDPPTFYRLLLLIAVNHDAPSYPEDLLSPFSKQLLVECAIRWRISPHLRELTFAECMLARFSEPELGREIRFSSLCRIMKRAFGKLLRERTMSTAEDLDNLLHLLIRSEEFFRSHFLSNFSDSLSQAATSAEDVIESFEILERIYSDPLYQKNHASLSPTQKTPPPKETLVNLLITAINDRYKTLEQSISSETERDLSRVTYLAKAIRMEVNAYVWRYPDLLLGTINVAGFATSTYLNFFVLEMENLKLSPAMAEGDYTIAEMLELYQIVRILKDLGQSHDTGEGEPEDVFGFDVEQWFEPFVSKWIMLTDKKVDEWVGGSVSIDAFQPILAPSNMYSSSVVDIFAIFHQALDFIDQLKWPNEVTKGSFLCSFAKVMSKAMEKFCSLLLLPFLTMENANAKPEYPVDITPNLCVRMNSLFDAYKRFEDVVDGMDIPHYAGLFTPELGAKHGELADTIDYRVEVLRARDLPGKGQDYYAKLFSVAYDPISRGSNRYECGQTQSVVDCLTGDPNWNESLFVRTTKDNFGTVEVDVCLYDREKFRSDKLIGDSRLLLSSADVTDATHFSPDAVLVSNLDDFLPQEIVIPLDAQQARIWLRLQREGADNDPRTDSDIRFWVVRTALGLENALETAVRIVTEQTVRFARHCYWTALVKLASKSTLDAEPYLTDCLNYLDHTLAIINMYTSKAVGHWVFRNRNLVETPVEGHEGEEGQQPNLLTLHIWEEFLNSIKLTISALDKISASNPLDWAKKVRKSMGDMFSSSKNGEGPRASREYRKRLEILLREIELAKSLMYCEAEDLHYGFEVAQLEMAGYGTLRAAMQV